VAVTRGLVEVDSDDRAIWLHAGEHWPDDRTLVAGEADGGTSDPALAATPDPTASAPPAPRDIRSDHSLALENRLFAAAMARRKAGDLKGALRRLERFLEHHPDSVLVQEARVEHFRLLERLGRKSRAAREARSYLSDYPDGYATEEARRLELEKR
jgi:TolA-binding protein